MLPSQQHWKLIFCFVLISQPLSSFATVAEDINACVAKKKAEIENSTRAFQTQETRVAARAGVVTIGGCARQEEHGDNTYVASEEWKIISATPVHGRDWENASEESFSWNERQAKVQVKVNGHGCDRHEDAIAKFWLSGTESRIVTTSEINAIWQQCLSEHIKQ